jgi:hypothetical protein
MGFRLVGLADFRRRVRTRGVEVAQRRGSQAPPGRRFEGAFDAHLGGGIGVDRRDPVRFGQQLGLRQAVDGAGAGEHERFDLVP